MTTHEIISAKEAPTPDPSTPGEVERLVDALIEASQAAIWHRFGPQPAASMPGAASAIDAARTALLSHITAARPEGAGDLARLSAKATQGKWSVFHSNGVVEIQDARGNPVVHWSGFDQRGGSRRKWLADASYIVALANANRSPATNPRTRSET